MQDNGRHEADTIAAKPVEFHEDTHTFRTEFDSQTRPPSAAVIAAVAAAKDAEETVLPPLFGTIDPDAMDSLFVANSNRTRHRGGSITFNYSGCQVAVNSHGTVVVDPAREIEAVD